MMRKRILPIVSAIAIVLLAAIPMQAAETGMLNLLNLTGARQVAMGETIVLSDSDPFNLEYNPAAITGLERGKAGFSHNEFFENRSTNSLAIIFPAGGLDFGAHIRLSSVNDIEARGDNPSTEPDYLFDAHDFASKIFAAKQFNDRFRAGVSFGLLLEKIDTDRATAIVFGLGGIYQLQYGISVHGSASNLGGNFHYHTEDQKVPSIFRLGAGYSRRELNAAIDYVSIKSGDNHIHVGAEYLIEEILFLRAGYQTGYDNRDLSAGIGVLYNNWRFDYAFVPYDSDLGSTHRLSLTVALR